jgi:superoxide dismutase, Fe-Mn family
MKATEFALKKRPYSDDEAKTLLAKVMDAETSDWHYNTHHKGYVDKLNEIEKSLLDADVSKANGNYSQFGELKRRWTWNHSGTILHDVYWECLGGDGDPGTAADITERIHSDFGSFEEWKTDFKATALAAKLSGWGLLVFDTLGSGQLKNVLVDEHHYGAVWGAIPLVACDVFEHAYYHKDGPKRAAYIDNFINGLNWGRVNDRFLKYTAQ